MWAIIKVNSKCIIDEKHAKLIQQSILLVKWFYSAIIR